MCQLIEAGEIVQDGGPGCCHDDEPGHTYNTCARTPQAAVTDYAQHDVLIAAPAAAQDGAGTTQGTILLQSKTVMLLCIQTQVGCQHTLLNLLLGAVGLLLWDVV